MRKRNWRQYNKDLVQRGSLNFLIDPKTFKNPRQSRRKSKGRPFEFSDELIIMLLMVKINFRLSYRALEGFSKSILTSILNRPTLPCYSLICKRASQLRPNLPKLSNRRASIVLLDASGIRVYGEGEWKVKIHGRGRPRNWLKIHIAIDERTQEIVSELTTTKYVADSAATETLLDQLSQKPKVVIADGAYDRSQSRAAIKRIGASSLIPPPKNARYRGRNDERDQAVLEIQGLGGDDEAKSIWKKSTGYHRRSLVETAFSRFKRLFGDRLFSQTTERQLVENKLKCILLNRMLNIAT